jgi:hypothetical protein
MARPVSVTFALAVAGLRAWCAVAADAEDSAVCKDEAFAPGQEGYCVQLEAIYSLDGEFDPPFDPKGTHFKLHIDKIHQKSAELRMRVDVTKYIQGGYPKIFFDGEQQENYDPLQELTRTFQLDNGIDAVEQDFVIKLEDPFHDENPLHTFKKKPVHEYTITVMQKPEWDKVVRVDAMNITNAAGKPLEAEKPFNASSERNEYSFQISKDACAADKCIISVQVTCSPVATGMKIDGEAVAPGTSHKLDMTNSAMSAVLVGCFYDNDYWTEGVTRERIYTIILKRDIEFKGNVDVHLLPAAGVCDKVVDANGVQSFDCRSLVDNPKMIVHSTQSSGLSLTSPGADHSMPLTAGIPMTVSVPDSGAYELSFLWGTETLKYSIKLYKPAECLPDTLECPQGQALKEPSTAARDHLCHEDTCTVKDDAPFCCGDRAYCSEFGFPCEEDEAVIHNAHDVMCEDTICKEKDTPTCCGKKAMCSTYDLGCPEGQGLRVDADRVMCAGTLCIDEDEKTCCKSTSIPTCESIPLELCPEGKGPQIVDGPHIYCKGDGACDKTDADACCNVRASCSDFFDKFECPEHHLPQDDFQSILCRGDACVNGAGTAADPSDAETCCVPQASCSTMDCGNLVVLSTADKLWCAAKKCAASDEATCCAPPANCLHFESACPEGKSLAYRAGERLCRHEICGDDDIDMCCVERGSCSGLTGACPSGTHLQADRVCQEKECTTHDSDLCCELTVLELRAMMRVNNLDWMKIEVASDLRSQVENIAIKAISAHIGVPVGKVDVMIANTLAGTGVNIQIEIDATQYSANVAKIQEAMKNKEAVAQLVEKDLLGRGDLKIDPAVPLEVTFLQLAQAMVDPNHGGLFMDGRVRSNEDGSWTVQMDLGEDLSGVKTDQMEPISGEGVKVGARVRVLCPLYMVANWHDKGWLSDDLQPLKGEELPSKGEDLSSEVVSDFDLRMGAEQTKVRRPAPAAGGGAWAWATAIAAGALCAASLVLVARRRYSTSSGGADIETQPLASDVASSQLP